MDGLPDALFVIDVGHEKIAIHEAQKLGIPVVAVVDTNCSPEGVGLRDPGQRRRHARDPALCRRHRRRRASKARSAVPAGAGRRGRIRRARRGRQSAPQGAARRRTAPRPQEWPPRPARDPQAGRRAKAADGAPTRLAEAVPRTGPRRWPREAARQSRSLRGTAEQPEVMARRQAGAAPGGAGEGMKRYGHDDYRRSGQDTARAHRRRHDGVQEGAGRNRAATSTPPPR